MEAKDVARLLNNESNLKILEKLKEKPYYPRELATAMGLSEPFIVRRLKAMEEQGIVESGWDTENGRKVKRYHLKDVKIEYGREGFKAASETVPQKTGISMKKEVIGRLIKLPLGILFMAGIIFNIQVIIAAMAVFLLWYSLISFAMYRTFGFKTSLLSGIIYSLCTVLLSSMLVVSLMAITVPEATWPVVWPIGICVMAFLMLYQARFYQLELDDMLIKAGDFIDKLDTKPTTTRLFYFPYALKWKVSEYFKLI